MTPIFSWFSSIETINILNPRTSIGSGRLDPIISMLIDEEKNAGQLGLFGDDEAPDSLLSHFKSLLRNADVGIIDMQIKRKEPSQGMRFRVSDLEMKHQSESDDGWLPLAEESRGTRRLFQLALPIFRTIRRGCLMVVDELQSSMHPNLAEHLVRQFNDPVINDRNAQLIFSTHDTNLLGTLSGEAALRRDQVWLTEKDAAGATVLYP